MTHTKWRSHILRAPFFKALKTALPATRKTTLWLLELMIPITLGVTLLKYFGILAWIAQWLNPLFVYIGLPGESAVAFISGAAAGTYAGIAAMMTMHFTLRQATILCIMILLCHALPMECSVNKKTGSSLWKMAVIRIIAAFLGGLYLNWILPDIKGQFMYLGAEADSSFEEVIITWAWGQLKMGIMVFLIIYSLMIVQNLIQHYGLMEKIGRYLAPLMIVFGLPANAAYIWLVGNVLGISYGSAVMLELTSQGTLTKQEANEANFHLVMNHSLLEDTIVAAAAGVSPFWVITTRVGFAIILVWMRKLFLRAR